MDIEQIAQQIVAEIEEDFTDRRGLRQEWDEIDEGIKQEIRDEWTSITLKILVENS